MKAKTYFIVPVFFGLLMFVSVLCGAETTRHVYREDVKKPNPALEGIEKIYVILKNPDPRMSSVEGLVWKELLEKIEQTLKSEGLQVEPGVIFSKRAKKRDICELRVRVELKPLHAWNIYVIDIQSCLAVTVHLPEKNLPIKAEVWKTVPVINVTNRRDMAQLVTKLAIVQAKSFAADWKFANPQTEQDEKTKSSSNQKHQQKNKETKQ